MDIQAIASALIEALQQSSLSQIGNINQQRNLNFQQIQNNANASGLLFSTKPGFQQAQYVANNYIPAITQAQIKPLTAQVKAQDTVRQALDKIKAMNLAADEVNRIEIY